MSEELLLPPSQKTKPYERREYVITVYAILILVGFYFSQDQPQALQVHLRSSPFSLTGQQFNFIYFITNVPNIVFSVIGGIVIDRIGIQKSGIIFCLGIFIAQSLVTFSIYWKTSDLYQEGSTTWYAILLLSRGFFGVCGENLHIVQAAMVSIIVPNEHISTVLGLCLSIPLLFTSLNSLVSTEVYDSLDSPDKMYVPFLIGACTCFCSFIGMIGAVIYFSRHTKKTQRFVNQLGNEEQIVAEKVECNQIKDLGSTFWLIVAQGLALPGIWYGFMDNVVECLHERFGLQVPDAGKLVMIPYIVCSICCPFYGYVSNKYLSKRKLLIFLVPTFAALAHFIIFMIPNTKEASAGTYILIVLGLTILGLAFSGYVSIVVPSVSLVVDEAILGTAFGVLGMSNSVTESVFPMISSVIIEHWSDGEDESEGYRVNSLLFLFVCIMAMMAGLLMLLSRNKKSRELDNLEEFEDWDGQIDNRDIDELFSTSKLQGIQEVRESEEKEKSEAVDKSEMVMRYQ